MGKKIKAILNSVRFWIVSLGAVLILLEEYFTGGLMLPFVFNVVEAWLGVVVGIGTLDSFAEKFSLPISSKKK